MSNSKWITDAECDVSVKVRNSNMAIKGNGSGKGYVWVDLEDMRIYSCYVSPNVGQDVFEAFLNELEASINKSRRETIITGDLNSKSPEWGAKREDRRGNTLTQWMAANNMVVQNKGNSPTFERGEASSHIDITCVTEGLAKYVDKWEVLQQETLSDHKYLYTELGKDKTVNQKQTSKSRGWVVKKLDKTKFTESLKGENNEGGSGTVDMCINRIRKACDAAMPRKIPRITGRREVYWWTEDIAQRRRECIRLTEKGRSEGNRDSHL